MHPVYLPFLEAQLRGHFVEIAGDASADPERHLAYYRQSIKRVVANLDQPALTPAEVRRARQIEKDERFWVVASLMALYHSSDRRSAFSELLTRAGLKPPAVHATWDDALDGDLHLWFEVSLPAHARTVNTSNPGSTSGRPSPTLARPRRRLVCV